MDKDATILVTGARGFVGTNLVAHLREQGFTDVSTLAASLDYYGSTMEAFACRPRYVFHLAAFVNGLAGNMAQQAKAYEANVAINTNVVRACAEFGVEKLVAMGTVAMYPSLDRPLLEGDLWSGPPHRSEWGYAQAKRGMLAHLEAGTLKWAMPLATNLYGPYDRFDVKHGHVIPSLVRKFYEAKRRRVPVPVWGDGSARRDFLHVRDACEALVEIMDKVEGPVNLATGATQSIAVAVSSLAAAFDYDRVEYDPTQPVGQQTRTMDVTRILATGWRPRYALWEGLAQTAQWYTANEASARKEAA